MATVTPEDFVAEIVVAAPPAVVWEAVSDPARMARWSPEVVLVRALGPVRAGTRTLNLNRRGPVVWPTVSVLERVEPGRALSWRVPLSGTVWSLELRAGTRSGSTVLVHRRRLVSRPLVARAFAPVIGGVDAHDRELAAAMHRTLAAIRADVEGDR